MCSQEVELVLLITTSPFFQDIFTCLSTEELKQFSDLNLSQTLISHAGPLGEKVKNLRSFKFRASDIQKISVLKLHAWRQKICMPDVHVVKRLAQAVLGISQVEFQLKKFIDLLTASNSMLFSN